MLNLLVTSINIAVEKYMVVLLFVAVDFDTHTRMYSISIQKHELKVILYMRIWTHLFNRTISLHKL